MTCRRAAEIDLAAFAADRHAPEWEGFRAHYPVCPDCSRAVAGWARLRTALGVSMGESAPHVAEADLLDFASEPARLPTARRRAVEAHLAGCAPCRSELAVLRRFDLAALGGEAQVRTPASPEPSLAERLRDWLAATLGPLREPAFAVAVLVLLAIPASVAVWRLWWAADASQEPPPIAHEEPAPIAPAPIPSEEPAPQELAQEPVEPAGTEETGPVPDLASPEPAPVVAEREPVEEAPAEVIAEAPPVPPTVTPRELASPSPERLDLASLLPEEPPVYRERFTVAAAELVADTVVRGSSADRPALRPLAPAGGGATAQPAPTLYWHLSGTSAAAVELTLIADDGVEPLLELRLEAPVPAGLHALSLAEHGVTLAADTTYAWYVTLIADAQRRDLDLVAGVPIRYVPASGELERRLEETGPGGRAHLLAQAGYWIDAFDDLTRIAAGDRAPARARAHRVALLQQAGLDAVAEQLDRSAP